MWSIFRRNVMLSEAKHLASLEEPDPSLRCSENVYLKLRFGCHWQLVCQWHPSQAPHWQTSCQWHPTFVLRGSGAAQDDIAAENPSHQAFRKNKDDLSR